MEAEKTDKYSIMLDNSGSTGNSSNYWPAVQQILALYGQKINHFYFWNSSIREVDKKVFEKACVDKRGQGGTDPTLVAKEIVQKQFKNIILITDGQVSDHSVQECDKILGKYQFDKTICYIISTSGYGGCNMSVTCPFTRNCENEVYEKPIDKPFKKLVQYTPEDYKILDTLDDITLENFEANFDKIQGLIIALNMGKDGNIPLKNQLVVMKNRLVKELSKQKGNKDINAEIRAHLEKDNLEDAIQIARNMTNAYFSDNMTTDLEKNVSHLINLCGDLRGKYDINQIKSNKMAIAKDAKEGTLEQVEVSDLSKNPIECPIIMDEDVPQILIDEGQPVFLGVQKSIVDDISACPLRILNYPEVKAKLKARLSNFMGVKYADKFLKNPFTQNKLLGAIPLGCHKTHVTVGNHTIAHLMSAGKILGNLNMFFAAIWYIIKEKQIEYLKEIEKNATEHLLFRLRTSSTFASMCGLAQFVTTQISSDIAVWYCVNSCVLNQPADKDTFRFHLYNINPMIDIVKELGYPIDKGVPEHLKKTKALLNGLSAFKKMTNEQKKNLKQSIRGVYQNSIEINAKQIGQDVRKTQTCVKYIPIDGPASEQTANKIIKQMSKQLQELSVEEIFYIVNLLDAQKSAADLTLVYNFKAPALPEPKINWAYGLKVYQKNIRKINPKTFRPQSTYGDKKWQEFIEQEFKVPVSEMIKGRKYLEGFWRKYNKMPTIDELIVFYYNRYVIANKKTTLPFMTKLWAEQLIQEYTIAFEEHKITLAQALVLLDKSMPRGKRLIIQSQ